MPDFAGVLAAALGGAANPHDPFSYAKIQLARQEGQRDQQRLGMMQQLQPLSIATIQAQLQGLTDAHAQADLDLAYKKESINESKAVFDKWIKPLLDGDAASTPAQAQQVSDNARAVAAKMGGAVQSPLGWQQQLAGFKGLADLLPSEVQGPPAPADLLATASTSLDDMISGNAATKAADIEAKDVTRRKGMAANAAAIINTMSKPAVMATYGQSLGSLLGKLRESGISKLSDLMDKATVPIDKLNSLEALLGRYSQQFGQGAMSMTPEEIAQKNAMMGPLTPADYQKMAAIHF